jgi:ABC-type cobalamin transport system ATPase subunit
MLKSGRVLAAGTRDETLKPRNLAETFGAEVTLRKTGGRYQLAVRSTPGRAVC